MYYCWASYQFAEHVTTCWLCVCTVLFWTMASNRYNWQYSKSHNSYVLHTLPFSFHIWSHIEATMSITCVLIIPENGFYFRHLTRFLTETETWVLYEDILWATCYENVFYALFDKIWPSYFTLWKDDVINDVMGAWHMTCTTICLHLYTCKILFVRNQFVLFKSSGQTSWQTNTQDEDITSLSRLIKMTNVDNHDQIWNVVPKYF